MASIIQVHEKGYGYVVQGQTLMYGFPFLVCLNIIERGLVDVWDDLREGRHWIPYFTSHLNDWELDNVKSLFSRLQGRSM